LWSLKDLESLAAELPGKNPTMNLFSLSIKKFDNQKIFFSFGQFLSVSYKVREKYANFSGDISGKKCLKLGISAVSYCITLYLDI
jgi:hypothetical protein